MLGFLHKQCRLSLTAPQAWKHNSELHFNEAQGPEKLNSSSNHSEFVAELLSEPGSDTKTHSLSDLGQ